MLISPDTMRIFLLACLLGMLVLAAFYLQRRRMTLLEYVSWGLLAVLIPGLGPFLVILSAPGQPRQPYVRYGRSMRWRPPRWVQRFHERIKFLTQGRKDAETQGKVY